MSSRRRRTARAATSSSSSAAVVTSTSNGGSTSSHHKRSRHLTTTTTTTTPIIDRDEEFAKLIEMGYTIEDATAGLAVFDTAEEVVLGQVRPELSSSGTKDKRRVEKKLQYAKQLFATQPNEFKSYLMHNKQRVLDMVDPAQQWEFITACVNSTVVDATSELTQRVMKHGFSEEETLRALRDSDFDESIALGILKSLRNVDST